MNTHWVYSMPGSLVITAILAWPVSRQESEGLLKRIRFCVLSMLGVALLVWGIRQPPKGFHGAMSYMTVAGPVITMVAGSFLILLWAERINGMLTDLLLGCVDSSDERRENPKDDLRQLEMPDRLFFRSGYGRRPLHRCDRFIASNYTYWAGNSDTSRIVNSPRMVKKFRGRFSNLNGFLIF